MKIADEELADFNKHEVVFVAPVPGKENNTIIHI